MTNGKSINLDLEKNEKLIEEKKELNLIISRSRVNEISKKELDQIGEKGKISTGYDNKGNSIKIIDTDYGKSAELMRYVIE